MNLEERIKEIECLLRKIIERLQYLEKMLELSENDRKLIERAMNLIINLSIPVSKALEAAYRISLVAKSIQNYDPISRSIIEALSTCEMLSISEIERRVRGLRGSASRRIISARIRTLMSLGIVIRSNNTTRPKYMLKVCQSSEKD